MGIAVNTSELALSPTNLHGRQQDYGEIEGQRQSDRMDHSQHQHGTVRCEVQPVSQQFQPREQRR